MSKNEKLAGSRNRLEKNIKLQRKKIKEKQIKSRHITTSNGQGGGRRLNPMHGSHWPVHEDHASAMVVGRRGEAIEVVSSS